MLVARPHFDFGVGVLLALFFDRVLEFFLSAARSASPAASGWRGRGCWIDQPMATSASKPRWS